MGLCFSLFSWSFIFLTCSPSIWKFKCSRVSFSLMYFQEWLTTLSEWVCVPGGLCSLSIGFWCWKGEMHHWRKCSKHIQQNSQNVECSVNISFFHQREKDRGWLFLCLASGTNSQLWTNYCHRWPVCCCQSKMTHDVLATLHISSCSCLYRTILSSFTHPYAIPDPFYFFPSVKHKRRCLIP